MSIQGVDTAVVLDRQRGNQQIWQWQGYAFAEQMRRKITGLRPSGLSDFEVPQSQESFREGGSFGLGPAALQQFSQHDTDQSDLICVNEHIEDDLSGESARLRKGIQTEVSAMTMSAAFQNGLMTNLGLFQTLPVEVEMNRAA